MDELCGLSFKLSVPTFYQVNREQAERLYAVVREYAGLTGQETVLDLYCGAGTIGLCLADAAKHVIGVEVVPEAVADAKENARRNGIENAEFFCADAGEIRARLTEKEIRPDLIIVDPPRKGLRPEVIGEIAAFSPERVVYVSCDPATLARDLKLLAQHGYEAQKACSVDLFPRTSHVETVVLMSRVENQP
jgi:23S rRNA (uracil1939-C5)-methyltransferase